MKRGHRKSPKTLDNEDLESTKSSVHSSLVNSLQMINTTTFYNIDDDADEAENRKPTINEIQTLSIFLSIKSKMNWLRLLMMLLKCLNQEFIL